MQVELVTTAEGLSALEPDWWDLWRRCDATPFQSPAWLIAWWATYAPGTLQTLAVRQAGQLAALAPLYLEHGALGARLLPLGLAVSDWLDVLIDPACAGAGMALARALGALEGWESLWLQDLAPDAASLRLPPPAGASSWVEAQEACPVLACGVARTGTPGAPPQDGEDPGALCVTVPAAKRRKLRMAQHRCARRGLRARGIAAQADLPCFLQALCALNAARWSGTAGGMPLDALARAFHARALPRLLAAQLVRLELLVLGERPVAAYYGLLDAQRAHAYVGGFDPDFAFESPGTLLLGRAIAAALRAGRREFHFLRGREAYKYDWGAVDVQSRRRIFSRAGRGTVAAASG